MQRRIDQVIRPSYYKDARMFPNFVRLPKAFNDWQVLRDGGTTSQSHRFYLPHQNSSDKLE